MKITPTIKELAEEYLKHRLMYNCVEKGIKEFARWADKRLKTNSE